MRVFTLVWIYAVLTFIQTAMVEEMLPRCLDICRINSYSNFFWSDLSSNVWIYAVLTLIFKLRIIRPTQHRVWIYAVLTLIQTSRMQRRVADGLDICRINSYSNCRIKQGLTFVFGYMPY